MSHTALTYDDTVVSLAEFGKNSSVRLWRKPAAASSPPATTRARRGAAAASAFDDGFPAGAVYHHPDATAPFTVAAFSPGEAIGRAEALAMSDLSAESAPQRILANVIDPPQRGWER
jgi:hypothetical protein